MASGLAPQSAIKGRAFTKTTIRTIISCAGAACLAVVCFLIIQAVAKQLFSTRKFCVTEDCVRHTTLLTKYLDPNRDPCENFSAYVCSAWYTSSDHSEQVTSVLDSLRFSWYQHFRDILLQGALKIPAGEKPLAMYDMCSTGYKSGASQRAPFLEFLKSHKLTWPEPPAQLHEPLGLIIYLAYKWQSPSWVSVRVLEPAPSGQQRILVSPGLYMPIVRKQHQNIKLTYVKYWELFLVHLYPDATTRPRINVTDVENVRDVEGDILEAIDSVMRSAKMQPALFLFSEISHHVPSASASVWVDGFQRGLSLEPKLTPQDYLAVSDLSLIITVAELLAKYNVRQLNIHMIWLLVQYHSLFAGYEFLKIHYGSERKAMTYLPAYCAHRVEVSYKVLVVALGFHSLFTEQDRSTIDIGFDSLVTAAVKKIDSAEWMDKESKVRVSTKLAAVKKALWPPAAVLDRDELERIYANFPGKAESFFEYWILASTAAAKYKKTREYLEAFRLRWNNLPDYIGYNYVVNSVELAIAAATPPSYYRNGTKAMLYGGFLFLMATQLVRAIDAEGLKWTSNGTVVNSILTDSTYAKFQAKASCNNGMENSSVFPEIPALDITYSALKNSYLLDEREPLPLREDLPAEKVFFMTVCYLTCANPSGHYPFAADCNKLVQNSKSFAHVFNCPKGSKMNPVEKCSFFT
ncbi:membrane metallo-endopeptidase-like 1 [Amblyomma americanum]